MKTSRRHFLKIAGFSAMALASGLAAAGAAEAQIAPGRYVKRDGMLTAKRWAMVIDTRRFRTEADYAPCIEACQKAHNIPDIHDDRNVKWIWTDTFEHVFPDEMNAHLNTATRSKPYLLLCNHCTNPPCVRVCPTQATYKMEDGIVAMDYHRCIGCRFCMAGCPYGARSFNFVDPRNYLSNPVPNPDFPTRMIARKGWRKENCRPVWKLPGAQFCLAILRIRIPMFARRLPRASAFAANRALAHSLAYITSYRETGHG